jgi:integrase
LIGASAFRAACFDVPEFRKRRFSPHDRSLNSVTILICIVTVSLPKRAKAMENQHAHFEAPTAVNVTVMTKRPREYLKEPEIERLTEAARKNRQGHRDATAILLAYRHGLRASELVSLRWDDPRPRPRPLACTALQGRGNRRPPDRRQGNARPATTAKGG